MKSLFVLIPLCSGLLAAAIPSNAVWEIRPGGSAANGGCYVPVGGGTDYSMSDTPQFSGTNLVVNASVNTKVTSATHNFVASDVGNCITIPAGSGWSGGTYAIVSVAANAATLDASPAGAGTTGGTWKEGGGLAAPGNVAGKYVAGNSIYIKTGTYVISSTVALAVAGTLTSPVLFEGYASAHGDLGTAPTLTNDNATTPLITLSAASFHTFRNLKFTYTGASRGAAIQGINSSGTGLNIGLCVFDGPAIAVDAGSRAYAGMTIARSVFVNTTSASGAIVHSDGSLAQLIGNVCYNNTGPCYSTNGSSSSVLAVGNLFANNSYGYYDPSGGRTPNLVFINNTFANNTSDGIYSSASAGITASIQNNIFWGNGGAGVNFTANSLFAQWAQPNAFNGFGSNAGGNILNWGSGDSTITLTANPFTNASTGNTDYSLNNAAGGGALLRGKGFPGAWPGITASSHLDVGGLQGAAAGAGGGGAGQKSFPFVQ